MDDDRAFGAPSPNPSRASNQQLPPVSTRSASSSRPASTSIYPSSSTSATTPNQLSPTPGRDQQQQQSSRSKRASHAAGDTRHHNPPAAITDVYSHPAAVAYTAAHPRRQIPRFGPYLLLQTLGEGEFGKVKLGLHGEYGEEVAVKLIRRGSVDNTVRFSKIEREIEVLKTIKHPNIVRLYDVIETDKYIGIILEYASGGELFDHILAHRYLRERDAAKLFAQLISGVSYIHSKKIVHRDLKLENLLLDRNRNVIITDFGFANRFEHKADDLMQTSCGSPCYAAPELVISEGLYVGSAVDIWSCGVILYAMLAGYLPFDDDPANPDGDNINLLYKYIINTQLTFPEYVSAEARDLLSMMLVPDPARRCDLEAIKNHVWLKPFASLFEKSVKELEEQAMEIQNAKRLAYQKQLMRTREAQLAMQQVKMNRTQSARIVETTSAGVASSSASTRTRSGRGDHQPQASEFLYETSPANDLIPPTTGRRAVASAIIPTTRRDDDSLYSPSVSSHRHRNPQQDAPPLPSGLPDRDDASESGELKSPRTGKSSTKPSAVASPPQGTKKGGYRHTIQLEYVDTESNSSQISQPVPLPPPLPLAVTKSTPPALQTQEDIFSTSPMDMSSPNLTQTEKSVDPVVVDAPQTITTTTHKATVMPNGQLTHAATPDSVVETSVSYSGMPIAADSRVDEVVIDQSVVDGNEAEYDELRNDDQMATPKKATSHAAAGGDTPRAKKTPIPAITTTSGTPPSGNGTPPSPTLKRNAATEPALPTNSVLSATTTSSPSKDKEDGSAAPASPTIGQGHPPVSPSGHIAQLTTRNTSYNGVQPSSTSTSTAASAASSQKSGSKHRKGPSLDRFNLSKLLGTSSSHPSNTSESGLTVTPVSGVQRSASRASGATGRSSSSKPPTTGPKRPVEAKRSSTSVTPAVPSDQVSTKSKKSRRKTLSVMMGEQFGSAKAAVRERTKSSRIATDQSSANKENPMPPIRAASRPVEEKVPTPNPAPAEESINEKASLPPSSTNILPPTLPNLPGDGLGHTAASTGKAKKVMDWFRKKSLAKNVDSPFAPHSEPQPRHPPIAAVFPSLSPSGAAVDPTTPTVETYGASPHINSSSSTINNAPQVVVTNADGGPASPHAPNNWNPSPRAASGQSQGSTESAQSTLPATSTNGSVKSSSNGATPPAAGTSTTSSHVPVAKRAAEALAQVTKRAPSGRAFNKSVLRVHHGAVDQATITTGSPPEVFDHVTQALINMGIELHRESQYKYRCIRQKRRKAAGSAVAETAGHGLSAFTLHGSAASNGVDKRGLPLPSSNSFGGPSGMLRGLLRRGPSHSAHSPMASESETPGSGSESGLLSPDGTSPVATSPTTPSSTTQPKEPIYGDRTLDQQDEVRFSVELTRIDGLEDTYSLDIRRLKGNLRSYKFLYDTLRERATPA